MKFTAYDINGNELGSIFAPNFETAEVRAIVTYASFAYVLED